jgi:hypothetical protein
MLVLKQFVIVASGSVLGALAAGAFLATTVPAATRSLDYLLTAVVFLFGFAAGTAGVGRLVKKPGGLKSAATSKETAVNLGPLADLPATTVAGAMADLTTVH